jgi:hypothetical protein
MVSKFSASGGKTDEGVVTNEEVSKDLSSPQDPKDRLPHAQSTKLILISTTIKLSKQK